MSDEIDYSQYGAKSQDIDYSQYGHAPVENEAVKKYVPNTIGNKLEIENQLGFENEPGLKNLNLDKNLFLDFLSGRYRSPEKYNAPIGLGEMAARAIPKLAESVIESGGRALNLLGEQGYEALESTAQHPVRSAGTAAAGMGDLLQNLLNIPRNAPQTFANLGLLNPETAKKLTSPYQFDLSKVTNAIAGEKFPGSELIRKTFENLPVTLPVGKALTQASIGTAKTAAGIPFKIMGKTDPFLAAQESLLKGKISEKSQEIEQAELEHKAQTEKYNAAIAEAKRTLPVSDADKMEYRLNQHNKRLNEINNESATLSKNLEEMKEPTFEKGHIENAEKALQYKNEAKENINLAEEQHEKAKGFLDQSEKNIAQHLNEGLAHDVHVARYLKTEMEKIENEGKSSFSKLKKDLKDSNFKMPEQSINNYNLDLNNIFAAMNKSGSRVINPKDLIQNPYLQDLLEKAPTNLDTKASDFITKFQDYRDHRYDLYDKLKLAKTAEERNQIYQALKDSENITSVIKKTLDEGLGEFKSEWDRVNKIYSEQIYPLRSNSVARKVNKKTKMSENITKELRGDEPGNDILRGLIKKNPEALKNVVGQRFSSPNEIYNPNELLKEYIDQMPELRNLIDMRNEANKSVANSKLNIKKSKDRYTESEKQEKEYKDIAEKKEKEIIDLTKKHEKKKSDIQTKIENFKSESNELNEKSQQLKEHMKNIREKAKNKNISLEKHMSLKKEHDKLENELKEIETKKEKNTTGLRKLYLISKNLYKMGKKLT